MNDDWPPTWAPNVQTIVHLSAVHFNSLDLYILVKIGSHLRKQFDTEIADVYDSGDFGDDDHDIGRDSDGCDNSDDDGNHSNPDDDMVCGR